MAARPATRLLEGLAPWIPIAMLVALVGIAFYLRAQELGTGIGAVAWLVVAVASGLAGTCLPSHTLTALVVVLPIAPYLRYDTWLGQALPGVIAASVLVGVSLSPATAWGQMLRDQRRAIAMAVLTFAALLAVSLVLVLLQRSSFLLGALGREEVGGFFSTGWAVLRPQNTFPVDRSGAFLLGPVAGLAFLSLLSRAGSGGHGLLGRDRLVGALLVTSALNVGVATGQVYIPGFPVDTLYEPTAGLFYNPVGLAELMTLATPVALALSLQPGGSRWRRPLALATLVGVALVFVPIEQRSAHLGVAAGVSGFLALAWITAARRIGLGRRRLVALAGVAVVLLVVSLGFAYQRTTQWQQARDVIVDAPASIAWLGEGVRLEINRMALFMIGDRPLGGYGVGGFQAALPAYYDRHGPLVERTRHALLNHPLHMLVDLGALGLAANMWMFATFLLPGLRAVLAAARHSSTGSIDLVTLGALCGVGATLLLSIWTGEWMYDAAISVPAFMLLAVTAGCGECQEDQQRSVPTWILAAFPLGHTVFFAVGV